MTYLVQSRLSDDIDFGRRTRSALVEQSTVYLADARPSFVALASALLVGQAAPTQTFLVMVSAAPGFADQADNGDGTIDSSKIADGQILSAVQADYPTVAALFFTEDGQPI